MKLTKFSLAGAFVGIFCGVLLVGAQARADVSAFSLGATRVVPMGKAYSKLEVKTGIQGDLVYKHEALPAPLAFHLTGTFAALPVRGWSGTSFDYFGFYFGVIAQPETAALISPFVSVQVGTGYKSLSYASGVVDPIQNSSTSFALNISPGFDVPIAGGFAASVQLPWTTVFTSEQLQLWSAVLSAKMSL